MKPYWAPIIIAFSIIAIFRLVDLTIYVKNYYQPREPLQTKYAHFGGCPDCHLEKQPPDECGEFIGWAWEECQDLVHRYPNE